jgi:hypothetical protein
MARGNRGADRRGEQHGHVRFLPGVPGHDQVFGIFEHLPAFLWVRCPACRTTQSVDLRTIRSASRRHGDKPHSGAVVSIVSPECPFRRTDLPGAAQHRR